MNEHNTINNNNGIIVEKINDNYECLTKNFSLVNSRDVMPISFIVLFYYSY
jgi:hypothetical protein